jgi:hypothetical protein
MVQLISSYTDTCLTASIPTTTKPQAVTRHAADLTTASAISVPSLFKPDHGQFQQLLYELKAALHEHNNCLRN